MTVYASSMYADFLDLPDINEFTRRVDAISWRDDTPMAVLARDLYAALDDVVSQINARDTETIEELREELADAEEDRDRAEKERDHLRDEVAQLRREARELARA